MMELRADAESVQMLSELAGFPASHDELVTLAELLNTQLASDRVLREVDTATVEPITTFDPRWV